MSLSEWLEESTPDRREVPVCLDRGLVSRLIDAKARLNEAQDARDAQMLAKPAAVSELESKVAELEDQVRGKTRILVFEGLGWGAWRELVSEHPPHAEQADVFKRAVELLFMPHASENVAWNAETFVPAAIVASCTEPGISKTEAATLLRKGPPGVLERIWTAVLAVNLAGGDDPFVAAVSANGSREVQPSPKRSKPQSG